MPKVFEKDGYKFFFYSNEHRPMHVHVRRGGGEAVFNVEESVERSGMNTLVDQVKSVIYQEGVHLSDDGMRSGDSFSRCR